MWPFWLPLVDAIVEHMTDANSVTDAIATRVDISTLTSEYGLPCPELGPGKHDFVLSSDYQVLADRLAAAEAHGVELEKALLVAVKHTDGARLRHWLGSQDVVDSGDVKSARLIHEALRSRAASRDTEPDDPTEGLPPDLARVLRDQSIIVPQDAGLWEMLARWRDAPSDTASAGEAS